MRPNNTRLMIMVLSLVLTPAALASTWYVNGVSGSNSNNCTSPTTLQDYRACDFAGCIGRYSHGRRRDLHRESHHQHYCEGDRLGCQHNNY